MKGFKQRSCKFTALFMNDMLSKQRFSPAMQLAVLLILLGLGLALVSIAQTLIFKSYGIALKDAATVTNTEVLRWVQIIGSALLLGLPALLYALLVYKKPFEGLGFNSMISGKQVFYIVLLIVPAMTMSGVLAEITKMIPLPTNTETYFKQMEETYNKQVLALSNMQSASDFIVSIIILALIPAIVEEMFFRGAFQPVFKRLFNRKSTAIIATALLFSFIHFSFYGFLSRLFLGIMLGLIFEWSRNLWLNILLHFLNNAFVIAQMYAIMQAGGMPEEALNESTPWLYGLLTLPLLYMFSVIFYRASVETQAYRILDDEMKRVNREEEEEKNQN